MSESESGENIGPVTSDKITNESTLRHPQKLNKRLSYKLGSVYLAAATFLTACFPKNTPSDPVALEPPKKSDTTLNIISQQSPLTPIARTETPSEPSVTPATLATVTPTTEATATPLNAEKKAAQDRIIVNLETLVKTGKLGLTLEDIEKFTQNPEGTNFGKYIVVKDIQGNPVTIVMVGGEYGFRDKDNIQRIEEALKSISKADQEFLNHYGLKVISHNLIEDGKKFFDQYPGLGFSFTAEGIMLSRFENRAKVGWIFAIITENRGIYDYNHLVKVGKDWLIDEKYTLPSGIQEEETAFLKFWFDPLKQEFYPESYNFIKPYLQDGKINKLFRKPAFDKIMFTRNFYAKNEGKLGFTSEEERFFMDDWERDFIRTLGDLAENP